MPPTTPAESVDVVILCGGLGTRLRALVPDRPKPMADVGGRPFLELLVDEVASQGFTRFILCTGHGAAAISGHFRDGPGRKFLFSREEKPLGTGGALKLCEGLCSSDPILAMNGDSFCSMDLGALVRFHRDRKGMGTIAAVPGRRADGGAIVADAAGRVLRFEEKGELEGGLLNAGVYALSREALGLIPAGRPCSLEKDVFPSLLPRGLYVFPAAAPLYDIGTPERLAAFRETLRGRRVP